jgi:hypothetical protein
MREGRRAGQIPSLRRRIGGAKLQGRKGEGTAGLPFPLVSMGWESAFSVAEPDTAFN